MWQQYMKETKLQAYQSIERPSGAVMKEWCTVQTIAVAIFPESMQNQKMNTQDIASLQYDFVGITKAPVTMQQRLIQGHNVYDVQAIIEGKRYNTLYLKVIENGE